MDKNKLTQPTKRRKINEKFSNYSSKLRFGDQPDLVTVNYAITPAMIPVLALCQHGVTHLVRITRNRQKSGMVLVTDTPESENNHDVLSAIEQMMGLDGMVLMHIIPATL